MTLLRRCALIASLAVMELSCETGSGPDLCDYQQVSPTTSAGTSPLITWTPPCGMSALTILRQVSLNGPEGWSLGTGTYHANNVLAPGIHYGQLPPHAVAPGGADSLVAGVTYSLWLYRWIDSAGGRLSLRGSLSFTP
jgi:hypothetical protein